MPTAPMPTSPLGSTGFAISALSLGCGTVGGLMIRGEARDRERAVAMALEAGVTYFDNAASYGDGVSETHLGAVWKVLRPDARVGTKFGLDTKFGLGGMAEGDVAGEIERSLDASLARLQMDAVDLFQLHNPLVVPGPNGAPRRRAALTAAFVNAHVVPVLQRLKQRGKVRWIGFTGVGETAAILEVIEAGGFDTVQVVCNPLNPTAVDTPPPGFVERDLGQDYRLLARRAAERGMGTLGIRILAGGAMSGTIDRHAVASPPPDPIGSGADYAADVAQAQALVPVLARYADSPVAAAVRFAAYAPARGAPPDSAIIGVASLDQLAQAIEAVGRGPLPPEAIDAILTTPRT